MTDTLRDTPRSSPHALETALRQQIRWICQITRVCFVGYALMFLLGILVYWTFLLNKDFSQLGWRQWAALMLQLGFSCLAVYVAYCGWRLFSLYLNERIFSPEPALWLRRLAFFGIIARTLEIAMRPFLAFWLNADKNVKITFLTLDDLFVLGLLFGFLALAHIQKGASEVINGHDQLS